jgi:hypothetical protein
MLEQLSHVIAVIAIGAVILANILAVILANICRIRDPYGRYSNP